MSAKMLEHSRNRTFVPKPVVMKPLYQSQWAISTKASGNETFVPKPVGNNFCTKASGDKTFVPKPVVIKPLYQSQWAITFVSKPVGNKY